MQNTQNRRLLGIILGAAALLLCCCCTVTALTGAYFFLSPQTATFEEGFNRPPAVITRIVTPTPGARRATPAPGAEAPQSYDGTPSSNAVPAEPAIASEEGAIPALDVETQALMDAAMPASDARDQAMRFSPSVGDIPLVVNATPPTYKAGDTAKFWVSNNDTQEHRQVTAELKYVTDHVAMWVEKGVRLNQKDLEVSANRFEQQTYPTNRAFFGSEWTPGVDNDVRLHILHARGMGETVAGYYSSADEFSSQVNEYSNMREMFYISADSGSARPNEDFYDGTLAHEFQHMIHWANDRNEDSWVNEGMSELASYLNGFDPGGGEYLYAETPDTQLTTWADPSLGNAEHYGASYLFMSYFLDRFGEDLTKAVVASPQNGISGFNEALKESGRPERFDDVFADWVIANYLDAPDAADDHRFGYTRIDLAPMAVSESYSRYPVSAKAQVSQYGADYIRLRGSGTVTVRFEGQRQASVVDAEPKGTYAWWSNRGDQSDSTLTRSLDLRDIESATLTFSTWYDIEEGWDYAYVGVSTDRGETWSLLPGRYTTDENPVGNAFGVGWTGVSGGGEAAEWVDEQIDLTPYAGQEILVRFEMITDDAVNMPGLLLDDIAVPEIGYLDDAEGATDGWEAVGWARIDNGLAQRWLVQLLEVGDTEVMVQRMLVGPDGRGELTVSDLGSLQEAVLIISGLTPVTTEPATYSYEVTK